MTYDRKMDKASGDQGRCRGADGGYHESFTANLHLAFQFLICTNNASLQAFQSMITINFVHANNFGRRQRGHGVRVIFMS